VKHGFDLILLMWPLYVGRVFGSKGGLDYESVWLIWLVALCRALTVMQAPRFECLSFDPFSLLWSGFVTVEVDVRRRDVVQAFVETLVVVVIDEGFDLSFKITW